MFFEVQDRSLYAFLDILLNAQQTVEDLDKDSSDAPDVESVK